MKNLLLFILVCYGTAYVNRLQAQEKDGVIPSDLRKYTLLVMKAEQGIMQKSFNSKLKKALASNYDGPFELVTKKDLEDPKYADTSKYRYTLDAFVVSQTQEMVPRMVGGEMRGTTTKTVYEIDVFFFDRAKDKALPRTGYVTRNYITSVRELGKYLKKTG